MNDQAIDYLSYRIDQLALEIAPRMTRILNDDGFEQILVEKNRVIDEFRNALASQPSGAKEKKLQDRVKELEASLRKEKDNGQFHLRRAQSLEKSMEAYWASLKVDGSALQDQLALEMEEKWRKLNLDELVRLYRADTPAILDTQDFSTWEEREARLSRTATWILPDPESGVIESASVISETASKSIHGLKAAINELSEGEYCCQFMVRDLNGRDVGLWVRDADGDAIFEVFFDLTNERVLRTRALASFSDVSTNIQDIFGGWKLCTASFIVEQPMKANVHLNIRSPDSVSSVYVGDGQSGIAIWGFHIQKADLQPRSEVA